MSKRFGRNQKRKLRERAESLEAALQREQGLRAYLARDRSIALATLATVERILGQNFSGLPPRTIQLSHEPSSGKMWIHDMTVNQCRSASNADKPIHERCKIIEAALLHSRVDLSPLRQHVHILLQYEIGDGIRSGYALSEQAFVSATPEELIRIIGPNLLNGLRRAYDLYRNPDARVG